MTVTSLGAGGHDRRSLHLAVYGVLLAAAVVAAPVLGVVGARTLLDSRDGEVIDPVLDPSSPGYRALVPPSPTLAVLHATGDDTLVGVALLTLASEDAAGGAVVLVPPATMASVPDLGDFTLGYIHELNGTDSTASLLEWVLDIAVDDVVVLTDRDWADLVEPVGGLELSNPDDVVGPDGSTRFPAGSLTLAPDEVPVYLAALASAESPINRVVRQELVWEAWLGALAADPTIALGGEQDRGLARFAPALAAGPRRLTTLPVTPQGGEGDEPPVFIPDSDAIAALVADVVPFPAGARPGDRPLVRLIDGSGRNEVFTPAMRSVARAGGQVVMIGNADTFDSLATELVVADPELEAFARSVADSLGVGSVQVNEHLDDNAEVVVTLGADYQP